MDQPHPTEAHDPDPGGGARDESAQQPEGPAEESFAEFFRERHIKLSSMSLPLRAFTGFAIAQLLAALLLLFFSSNIGGTLPLFTAYGLTLSAPGVVLAATLVFTTMSWSFLIAGCLHGHPFVRPLGVLLFTGVVFFEHPSFAHGSLWMWGAVLGIAGLFGTVGFTFLWDRARRKERRDGHRNEIQWITYACVVAALALVQGSLWFGRSSSELSFGVEFNNELAVMAVLLIPVLFLAGIDLTEAGQSTSDFVTQLASRIKTRHSGLVLSALLAATVIWLGLFYTIPYLQSFFPELVHLRELTSGEAGIRIGIGVIVCGAVAAVIWTSGKFRVRFPREIPFGAVAGTVLLSYFTLVAVLVAFPNPHHALTYGEVKGPPEVIAVTTNPHYPGDTGLQTIHFEDDFTSYNRLVSPSWRLEIPAGWVAVANGNSTEFTGTLGTGNGTYAVLADTPHPGASAAAAVGRELDTLSGVRGASVARPIPYGGFYEYRFTANGGSVSGEAWSRIIEPNGWILAGWSTPAIYARDNRVFAAITDTWSVGTDPVDAALSGPLYDTDVTNSILSNVPVNEVNQSLSLSKNLEIGALLLMVAGLVIAAVRAKREALRGMFALAACFGFLAALIAFFNAFSPIGLDNFISNYEGLLGANAFTDLAGRALPGIIVVFSSASGIWLVSMLIVRRLRPSREDAELIRIVLGANLALLAIELLFSLFDAIIYDKITLPASIIVFLALMWDITMSGKNVTNRDSHFAPRHARVLMYLAYIGATSTVLLFYSSLYDQATMRPILPYFSSDFWPQQGIVFFGVPLVLTLFTVRMVRFRGRGIKGRGGEAGSEHPPGSRFHAPGPHAGELGRETGA